MSAPPVMILGCGRSGTSIFGELFEAISVYRYLSEPPFQDVLDADPAAPLAVKVPRETEGLVNSPGLSFPLALLQQRVPWMVYFWIVRHPLDCISSLRVGIAKNWGHHPRPPDWQDWMGRPLIEQCAHHWAYLNTVGFGQVADLAVSVRFEDMIHDTAGFVDRVEHALGLLDLSEAPEVIAWMDRVQDRNNAKFVEAMTSRSYSRPDHTVKVGRWQENLSVEDVGRALPIIADAAAIHGYDLPDT